MSSARRSTSPPSTSAASAAFSVFVGDGTSAATTEPSRKSRSARSVRPSIRFRSSTPITSEKIRSARSRAGSSAHAALHVLSLILLPFDPTLWIYLTLVHVASFAFAVLEGKGPQANWGRSMPTPLLLIYTNLLAYGQGSDPRG